ncbi:MAG: hypothetical protein GWN58_61265, partial [Anaerolineae bacterium]|nr:hypothetical protein [Anaerolineae bacterium]
MHMDVRHRWIPRVVRGATLLFTLGLLLSLWVWTCSQVALAVASPSGRGQVSSPGPLGLQVNVFNGNLSYSQTDLSFPCSNCTLPLDVYLTYNSQDAQIGGMMRLHG